MARGALTIAWWGRAPISIHWSFILAALFFSGFRLAPASWIGCLIVVLVHELGHATIVRMMRFALAEIHLTGFGGYCRWLGNAGRWPKIAIAWGGVAAQLVLMGGVILVRQFHGPLRTEAGADLFRALTASNFQIVLLNLLPIAPLDGQKAWQVIPETFRLVHRKLRRRQVWAMPKRATPDPTPSLSSSGAGDVSQEEPEGARVIPLRKPGLHLARVMRLLTCASAPAAP